MLVTNLLPHRPDRTGEAGPGAAEQRAARPCGNCPAYFLIRCDVWLVVP
jgi:hypothetical protein